MYKINPSCLGIFCFGPAGKSRFPISETDHRHVQLFNVTGFNIASFLLQFFWPSLRLGPSKRNKKTKPISSLLYCPSLVNNARKYLLIYKLKKAYNLSFSSGRILTESFSPDTDFYHKQLYTGSKKKKQWQKFIDTKAPSKCCQLSLPH